MLGKVNEKSAIRMVEFLAVKRAGVPSVVREFCQKICQDTMLTGEDFSKLEEQIKIDNASNIQDAAREGTQGLAEAVDKAVENVTQP